MALKTLGVVAKERGSYDVTVVLLSNEETPVPVTPVTFYWTWSDIYGNILNSRQKVEVIGDDLGSEITIKLDYADLVVSQAAQATGVLTVQGTYLDADGDTRYFADAVCILIDNLAGVQTL